MFWSDNHQCFDQWNRLEPSIQTFSNTMLNNLPFSRKIASKWGYFDPQKSLITQQCVANVQDRYCLQVDIVMLNVFASLMDYEFLIVFFFIICNIFHQSLTPFVIHQSLLLDFAEENFYLTVIFDTYIFTKCKLTKNKLVQNDI